LSIQTFFKPFLFSNNKEKMENKSFNRYWASPLEALGPLPHLACAARANGKGETARQGVGPWPFGLASAEAEATPALRRRGGAARPRGRRPLPTVTG